MVANELHTINTWNKLFNFNVEENEELYSLE